MIDMSKITWGANNTFTTQTYTTATSSDILVDDIKKAFNLNVVRQCGLIRAQYHTWAEPRNGIVAAADKSVIQALYLTKIRTAAQYFKIPITEVTEGKWSIDYSNDMDVFYSIEKTYGADDNNDGGG